MKTHKYVGSFSLYRKKTRSCLTRHATFLFATAVATVRVFGQSFADLDFENARLVFDQFGNVDAAAALPNWQVSLNGQPPPNGQLSYNYTALDLWAVSIYDTHGDPATILYFPPISGEYSVFMRGGRNGQDVRGFASIAQIGTVDLSSHSILFAANPDSLVDISFNAEPLQVYRLETSSTYATFGADITRFAGQTGELKFTANFGEAALLDDIRFSPEVVPEPSTFALLASGAVLLSAGPLRRKNAL